MRKTSNNNNELLNSCLSLALVLVFLVLSVTTFAWLAHSDSVEANGLTIAMDSMGSVSVRNVTLYRRDGAQGARIVTDDIVSLPSYDTLFPESNANSHVIIRAEISGLELQNGSYPAFNVVTSCKQDLPWLDEKTQSLTPLLSNIVEIRAAVAGVDLAQTNVSNAKVVYAGALELLSSTTSAVFVSEDNNAFSKVNSISISIADYDDKVLTENGDSFAVLFVEITYNDALVQAFLASNDIDISSGDATDIVSFDCDLTSFLLKGGANA